MVMELVGQERKELRKAIINAYPNISKLRIMVREELDENLDQIVGVGELDTVVFNLIGWAESTGKVKELVEAAYKGNPGNSQLQALRKQLLYSEPSESTNTSQAAQPRDSNQLQTQPFDFEIVTLAVKNSGFLGFGRSYEKHYSRGRAESFQEDLGNGVFLKMVKIPGGSFDIGSPENEPERYDHEGPQHKVNIQPFFMGKFPVTQEQYQAIMGENPSCFKGEKRPVEKVSWDNAVEFCGKISQRTGKTYRLPSEAEWEYACRAGTTTPFYFGETISTELANYRGTDWNYEGRLYPGNYGNGSKGEFREQTTDVGSFPPNAFGLYDMHGNVWEWCEDSWHENYNGAPNNGNAWEIGENDNHYRMLRGGSVRLQFGGLSYVVRVASETGAPLPTTTSVFGLSWLSPGLLSPLLFNPFALYTSLLLSSLRRRRKCFIFETLD